MLWFYIIVFCLIGEVWLHPLNFNENFSADDIQNSNDMTNNIMRPAELNNPPFNTDCSSPLTNALAENPVPSRYEKRGNPWCSSDPAEDFRATKPKPKQGSPFYGTCTDPTKPIPFTCAGPEVFIRSTGTLKYVGSCEVGHKPEILITPAFDRVRKTPIARYCCWTQITQVRNQVFSFFFEAKFCS